MHNFAAWFYQKIHKTLKTAKYLIQYILKNEALQPKLHRVLSKSNFCMKWHTPDFCLTNYTLLGIMKSTLIFSMLCHNTKLVKIVKKKSPDCSHAQQYLQIHKHAVVTLLLFIMSFFTK